MDQDKIAVKRSAFLMEIYENVPDSNDDHNAWRTFGIWFQNRLEEHDSDMARHFLEP